MIETLRHLEVFSPDMWGNRHIDVIGAGATGSEVAMTLANLGVTCTVWDFDRVAAHNVANQVYTNRDIGRLKVDALHDNIYAKTDIRITPRNERVDGSQQLGPFVFLLTDTMASRREIFTRALKMHIGVSYVVETRMAADNGRIYAFDPSRLSHVRGWEETLYTDDEAEVSICGASTTVGATAKILANLAVWQLIRWFSLETGKAKDDEEIENELIVTMRPMQVFSRQFTT